MALEKTKFIWMNGKLVEWDKAQVHVLVHALHYGSGVFEGIRFYEAPKGTAVFRLKDHMKRLLASAASYRMKIPYSQEELCTAALSLLRENKTKSGYLRPIAFFGYGKMGLNPTGAPVDVALACWPWGAYLGEEGAAKGIRCAISKWRRIDPSALPMAAKACGQYINSILASQEASDKKVDEAIMLNSKGNVAEGPGENLFLVKDGKLVTPGLDAGILGGTTRSSVMQIAKDFGLQVREGNLTPNDLFAADELFFTGTAAEITPIREVDGKTIGSGKRGPIAEKLQAKYLDAVHGKAKEYEKWLDYV